MKRSHAAAVLCFAVMTLLFGSGCQGPSAYRTEADTVAYTIINEKQQQVLHTSEEFTIERSSDTLRRRLLIEQKLPFFGETSLGSDRLKSVEHWPETEYPRQSDPDQLTVPPPSGESPRITLTDALQIGAQNSFEYQTRKEDIFRAALDLDLERNEFRGTVQSTLEAMIRSDLSGKERVTGTEYSGSGGVKKVLSSGVKMSAAIALDLVSLLTQDTTSSRGIVGDASITIPLLRGSGRHIVTEPLTQAERNVVYAMYGFERYKRTYAVAVASEYLRVLQQQNEVENAAENYRTLIASTRRSRRMADAGRTTEIEVDQAVQNELRARNRWITTMESYKNRLDTFKPLIGLPPDARVELDPSVLVQFVTQATSNFKDSTYDSNAPSHKQTPSADDAIELIAPGRENVGTLELEPEAAIALALNNRLDLRVAAEKVYDAQRKVVVAADALGAELTLLGSARLGESRSIATSYLDDARLRTGKGIYSGLLTLDLPFERTVERNIYRTSFITLERTIRDVQKIEDDIKISIRQRLRDMYESRESRTIQAQAVAVAEKRVKSTTLFFEAGRAQIRDLLEAQEALINARNNLTSAVIAYRIAELELQRDMGLLVIDNTGLWKEYNPEAPAQ